mgnify:CR=1 FL=1
MATSIATPGHSFWRVYLRVKNPINLKRYEIFSEQIVQFNQQYYVIDILLNYIWYIFIIRIFT